MEAVAFSHGATTYLFIYLFVVMTFADSTEQNT